MAVARLALTDFRSYGAALCEAGPNVVVLTGENGAGKTNVLEALSLLAPGRGLRGAALSEMARSDGPGGFAVAARLGAAGVHADLGTGTVAAAPDRRQVRINGAAATSSALAEWLSILWLTPTMDRLFTEGASGRRRFLDRLVLAMKPEHAQHATRYEAAMRARNRLLAEPGRADPAWLSALEAGLAEHGAAIAGARAEAVAALDARLAQEPDAPFARPAVALAGWLPAAKDVEAVLAADLSAGRARDAAAGRTLSGPHRTDLIVTHATKAQPAERCSTGEQKALLLSIVLAHAELVADRVGRKPLLLLDEVAAHLDPVRRAALFERLGARGAQTWLTGTERSLFSGLGEGTTWLGVRHGQIVPD